MAQLLGISAIGIYNIVHWNLDLSPVLLASVMRLRQGSSTPLALSDISMVYLLWIHGPRLALVRVRYLIYSTLVTRVPAIIFAFYHHSSCSSSNYKQHKHDFLAPWLHLYCSRKGKGLFLVHCSHVYFKWSSAPANSCFTRPDFLQVTLAVLTCGLVSAFRQTDWFSRLSLLRLHLPGPVLPKGWYHTLPKPGAQKGCFPHKLGDLTCRKGLRLEAGSFP